MNETRITMTYSRSTRARSLSGWSLPTWLAVSAALFLAGCATGINQAPVEDRSGTRPAASAPPSAGSAAAATPPSAAPDAQARANAELAGKPGYYQVKPGDTLIRIGLEQGQNWRDVARWNNIDNPNLIEVGQVLRVSPPGADVAGAQTRPVVPGSKIESKPLDPKAPTPVGPGAAPATVAAGAAAAPAAGATPVPATATPLPAGSPGPAAAPVTSPAPGASATPAAAPPPAPAAAASRDLDEDVTWGWPAAGTLASPFEEGRNKGLAIAGKAGDPVFAAADGRVVYAGSGLRGYGNLIIVKHNNTYLTAYAHNQVLLVKEDQAVRRGQRIAEMGSTDAERVQLHFEIRKQGKPIDPVRLLPPR